METITLYGKEYPVRTVNNKDFNYLVGSPELHYAIDWAKKETEETEYIDDQILYYADSNEWNMSDEELKDYLKVNGVLD